MTTTRFRHEGIHSWDGYRNVYYQTMRDCARKARRPEDVAGFGLARLMDRGPAVMRTHPDPVMFARVQFPNLVKDYWKQQQVQRCEGARGTRVVRSLDDVLQGDAAGRAAGRIGLSGELPGLAVRGDVEHQAVTGADGEALAARIRGLVSRDDWELIVRITIRGCLAKDIAEERGVHPSCISKRLTAALKCIRTELEAVDRGES